MQECTNLRVDLLAHAQVYVLILYTNKAHSTSIHNEEITSSGVSQLCAGNSCISRAERVVADPPPQPIHTYLQVSFPWTSTPDKTNCAIRSAVLGICK